MHTVPTLEYSYDALQPHISAAVMELHHDKHHQAYVDKLNAALEGNDELASLSVEDLLRKYHDLPDTLQSAIRNHGGGHYNHSLFWKVLSPNGGGEPTGTLANDLVQKFGSFDAFKEQFNAAAAGLFGSGWVWLTPDLDIMSAPNQDNPLTDGGAEPLMGLDVWEHAYYLDYKNKRVDYIAAWWNVVDWEFVASRYQ